MAMLFLGLIAAFHLLLQGDGSYTPWAAVSLPSAIPYANAYWMGYLLSLLIVFAGGDFLYKQGEEPQEGVSVRPFSNAAFLAGKMWGLFVALFQLNLAAMTIAAVVNLTLSDGPFSLWPYLFYLFTLTLPTVVFVTGLTFLVKGLCRNRAVALLALLLLFYALVAQGKAVLHGALDVYASGVPNIFSDVTGVSGLGAYLAQRGGAFSCWARDCAFWTCRSCDACRTGADNGGEHTRPPPCCSPPESQPPAPTTAISRGWRRNAWRHGRRSGNTTPRRKRMWPNTISFSGKKGKATRCAAA